MERTADRSKTMEGFIRRGDGVEIDGPERLLKKEILELAPCPVCGIWIGWKPTPDGGKIAVQPRPVEVVNVAGVRVKAWIPHDQCCPIRFGL